MGKMQSFKNIGFHDSSIVGIRRESGLISLKLEDVAVEGEICNATVRLVGVTGITCDGNSIDDLIAVYSEGEVWTLDWTEGIAHLIVDWTDFKEHLSQTHSYRINCDSFEVDIQVASESNKLASLPLSCEKPSA